LDACVDCNSSQSITFTEDDCTIYATTPAWSGFTNDSASCGWQWFDVFDLDNGTIADLIYWKVDNYWELTISNLYEGFSSAWRASTDPLDPAGILSVSCGAGGLLTLTATLDEVAGSGCSAITASI
jgi:hypothetical protein